MRSHPFPSGFPTTVFLIYHPATCSAQGPKKTVARSPLTTENFAGYYFPSRSCGVCFWMSDNLTQSLVARRNYGSSPKIEIVLTVNLSFKFNLLPLSYAPGCLWLGQTVQWHDEINLSRQAVARCQKCWATFLEGQITCRFYRVLTMVYNTQNCWGFGLYPSSGFQ
jgi:hypothetical protein